MSFAIFCNVASFSLPSSSRREKKYSNIVTASPSTAANNAVSELVAVSCVNKVASTSSKISTTSTKFDLAAMVNAVSPLVDSVDKNLLRSDSLSTISIILRNASQFCALAAFIAAVSFFASTCKALAPASNRISTHSMFLFSIAIIKGVYAELIVVKPSAAPCDSKASVALTLFSRAAKYNAVSPSSF